MNKEDLQILINARKCLGNVRDYIDLCEPKNPPWDTKSQWDECYETTVNLQKLIKKLEANI